MTQLSRAVQERRAPTEVEQDSPERKRWRGIEWYATPPWASRAGAELVKRIEPWAETAWDPCCGDGIMVECLKESFTQVFASDICPQGYGARVDFLDPRFEPPGCDWIFANPPFGQAVSFLNRALEAASSGVALLCRLAFLESEARYEHIYRGKYPLTVLAPFSERVPMQLGPWNPECSTATSYAWFLFSKAKAEGFPFAARVHPIPPGTRARLTKPTDIRKFCRETSAPLFEGEDYAEGHGVGAGA